jgi:hypothetical protein
MKNLGESVRLIWLEGIFVNRNKILTSIIVVVNCRGLNHVVNSGLQTPNMLSQKNSRNSHCNQHFKDTNISSLWNTFPNPSCTVNIYRKGGGERERERERKEKL